MIAVDWGTSSLRVYRLDGAGRVVDQRAVAQGLLACNGEFARVLAGQLEGWDDENVLLAGMAGSRSGWREVPYVACPAGLEEIAAGLTELEPSALPGRRVWIAPGVVKHGVDHPPEVMRGEETQVLGLLDELPGDGPHTLCLPGTHSKWVVVERGRIVSLRTAMTGELYALLRGHSLLAALMPAEAAEDGDDALAFARGVQASAAAGGLANHLFGVRTLGLFDALSREGAPSYLSGLLVGHELRGLPGGPPREVHLVGAPQLVERYRRALHLLDVSARLHPEASTARGLHRLASSRSLSD